MPWASGARNPFWRAHRTAEGGRPEEPRMMIVDGERVGLNVFGGDEVLVRDELFAHRQRVEGQRRELRHR